MKDDMRVYEEDFFSRQFCSRESSLRSRIHEDFLEYGISGKVYRLDDELDYLMHLHADRHIEIIDFKQEYICDDVILVHYVSVDHDNACRALRTSIWKKTDTGWKLYFHQGTKM